MGQELLLAVISYSFFAAVGFAYLFVAWLFYRLWCARRLRVVAVLSGLLAAVPLGLFLAAGAAPEALALRVAALFLGLPALCCAGLGILFARHHLRKGLA